MINNDGVSSNYKLRFLDDLGNSYPDWEIKKIKDIFEVERGPVLIKKQMKKEKTNDHIFPVYSSQTSNNGVIGYFNQYLFENAITWTTDGYYAGDFNYRNEKFYATTHCGILINSQGYSNEFIAELLNKKAKNYVIKLAQPMLQKNIVMDISLSLPSRLESQKLGSFLSEINNYLQLQREEINLTKEYQNKLLKQIFNKELRFLDENGNNYSNWETRKIRDLFNLKNGISLEKFFIKNSEINEYKVISIGNYGSNFKYFDNKVRISITNNEQIKNYILAKNDLVMILNDKTLNGNLIGTVLNIDENDKFVFNQRTLKMTLRDWNLNSLFFWHLLNSKLVKQEIKKLSQGNTQIYINKPEIENINLDIPCIDEQQKIANFLNNFNQQISQLELEYKNLNEYKNILLNKLIF